nr:SHOCT domain-containing protein [Anaerotignum sp.]
MKKMSQEQLQREYDYILAQKLLKSMLENGLITEDEFHKITLLNRKTFSPSLAELMA